MRIAVYYLQTEVVTMIYRPLYVDKIMAYVDTPFVKILTGVRRCGKSTILKMIMERLKTQHTSQRSALSAAAMTRWNMRI